MADYITRTKAFSKGVADGIDALLQDHLPGQYEALQRLARETGVPHYIAGVDFAKVFVDEWDANFRADAEVEAQQSHG